MPVNCDQLKKEDISNILKNVLLEFPVTQIDFYTPQWMEMIPKDHWLKQELMDEACRLLNKFTYIKDIVGDDFNEDIQLKDFIEAIDVNNIGMSDGCISISIKVKPEIYYNVLSELTQTTIKNEYELINTIKELASKKQEFDNVKDALNDVNMTGFGVVTPVRENITLDEPVVIKNGNKFGVKIKAQVPSVNMIKTNINVEIAPIVGTKQQADDLIDYIKSNAGDNPSGIWETNIFGKTVEQIVEDGIYEKTHNMTPESMTKIGDTLEKVMNENSGLVCLIV